MPHCSEADVIGCACSEATLQGHSSRACLQTLGNCSILRHRNLILGKENNLEKNELCIYMSFDIFVAILSPKHNVKISTAFSILTKGATNLSKKKGKCVQKTKNLKVPEFLSKFEISNAANLLRIHPRMDRRKKDPRRRIPRCMHRQQTAVPPLNPARLRLRLHLQKWMLGLTSRPRARPGTRFHGHS